MNPHNPIDDLFRQRLESYEYEPPLHLWEDIDARRAAARLPEPGVHRRSSLLLLGLFLLLAGMASLFLLPEPAPALRSFPVSPPPPGPTAATATALPVLPPAPPAVAESPRPQPVRIIPAAPPPVQPAPAGRKPAPPAPEETTAAPLSSSLPASPRLRSLPAPELVLLTDLQCVRFNSSGKWRLYADGSLQGGLLSRDLTPRTPGFRTHADNRIATETPQLALGASLRLSLVSDFGLAVRAGLQYTQINERFDYIDNREERITITNIYGPKGEIIGTDTIIEKGMKREVAPNRYRQLNLPLLLGYELHHNKWTFTFNGGAVVNLLSQARGTFIPPQEQTPAAFTSADSDDAYQAYRTNIGVGWYGGIGIHYQLPGNLQIMVEPHMQFHPHSISRDDYGLDQRYLIAGISLGLRKQL